MTNTPFATKHGVKGDEFETVLVVLDDSGAAWNFYSFDKYLSGADDAANPERANRSRNVFYVCCSRARQRLAVIDMGKASAAKTARMSHASSMKIPSTRLARKSSPRRKRAKTRGPNELRSSPHRAR